MIVPIVYLALLAAPTAGRAQANSRSTYRVGASDQLEIQVYEDDTLNVSRRVAADGTIAMPLVGQVAVNDRTADEIARILESLLERSFLQRATVDVDITEYRSQPISVLGAVRTPGTVYMDGRWNLFQAVAAAGGLSVEHGQTALILRRSSDGQLVDQLEVDLNALLLGGDQTQNVIVQPNDIVNVRAASRITIFFLGEVHTQGAVEMIGNEQATLLTAVAQAGGLTDRASSRIVIKRVVRGDQREEIPANFKRILAGTDPDIALEDGDLIVVKESYL